MKYQVPDLSGLDHTCNIVIEIDDNIDLNFSVDIPMGVYQKLKIHEKTELLKAYFVLMNINNGNTSKKNVTDIGLFIHCDLKVASEMCGFSEGKMLSVLKDLKQMGLISVERKFEGPDSMDEVYYIKFEEQK